MVIGIETDRGPWVAALVAAGCTVYPVNPLQASRYRERHGASGARATAGMRTCSRTWCAPDSHQLRPAAGRVQPGSRRHQGGSPDAEDDDLERTRAVQRLRHQLREYFPAAIAAFEDLDARTCWSCWARPADPDRAAKLTRAQVSAALKRARRRGIKDKTDAILAALRSAQLGQPAALTASLRRHRPGALIAGADHHRERAGQDPRRAGEGAFPAGIRTLKIYQSAARPGSHPWRPGARRVRRRPRPL